MYVIFRRHIVVLRCNFFYYAQLFCFVLLTYFLKYSTLLLWIALRKFLYHLDNHIDLGMYPLCKSSLLIATYLFYGENIRIEEKTQYPRKMALIDYILNIFILVDLIT